MISCKLDILVHPSSFSEQDINKEEIQVHKKLKFRFPWRINMLAKPKPPVLHKYQPPPPELPKVFGSLDPSTEFYSDQMSRPPLRVLVSNKIIHQERGPRLIHTITKNIDKTWDSIYNFYRKRLREKHLKRLKHKLARKEAKKPKGKDLEKIEEAKKERLTKLATPKPMHNPPEIPKKWKPLEELTPGIEVLASPKERHVVLPLELGRVSSKALLYEVTSIIKKLAELPERRKRHPSEDFDHWAIKRSALTATCTPRIEKLAQPSFSAREARKHEEDKFDPWAISPTALKYKATARILELAKPTERE